MGFDIGSGFGGIDLSDLMSGSDNAVLPDVSYGGADEQPSNPAGNGTGQWLMGAFDKAINYALQRDAMQMRVDYTAQTAPRPQQPALYQVPGQMNTKTLLIYGGIGLLAFLALKKS